ncbi:MAG: hypothetical protein IJY50_04845, partial [Clostridia bacterium]|nr:hypothetical protein [Clostridia bacterium]
QNRIYRDSPAKKAEAIYEKTGHPNRCHLCHQDRKTPGSKQYLERNEAPLRASKQKQTSLAV